MPPKASGKQLQVGTPRSYSKGFWLWLTVLSVQKVVDDKTFGMKNKKVRCWRLVHVSVLHVLVFVALMLCINANSL